MAYGQWEQEQPIALGDFLKISEEVMEGQTILQRHAQAHRHEGLWCAGREASEGSKG